MSELLSKINSLAVFRDVRREEPLSSLIYFLEKVDEVGVPPYTILEAYSEFVGSIFMLSPSGDISEALLKAVTESSNPYRDAAARQAESGGREKMSTLLCMMAESELKILDSLASLSYADLEKYIYFDGYIPQFKTTGQDISKIYKNMIGV